MVSEAGEAGKLVVLRHFKQFLRLRGIFHWLFGSKRSKLGQNVPFRGSYGSSAALSVSV